MGVNKHHSATFLLKCNKFMYFCVKAPSCFTVYGGAVVVTSGERVHRFSYWGPPSSRSRLGLEPAGVCTDVMSHILVSDEITRTVHMLDRDGKFLLHIRIGQTPYSLSYDVNTHVVWVSSLKDNMLYKYRYINRHLHLAGKSHNIPYK